MMATFWRDNRAAILIGIVGSVALWSMLAFAVLAVAGVSHCSRCDMTPYILRGLGISFLFALLFGFAAGFAVRGLRPLLCPYLGVGRTIVLLTLLTLGLAVAAVPVGLRIFGFVEHRIGTANRAGDTCLAEPAHPPRI